VISRKIGRVKAITERRSDITEIIVDIAGKVYPAINFDSMTGAVDTGDEVLLNTTAVDLNLGSGGYHFVMANLTAKTNSDGLVPGTGHIMKLRYTPFQIKVMAVEEQDSPYHRVLREKDSLDGTPVVCCTLHSMLPAAAASIRLLGTGLRVIYVMTDGAALPINLSRLVEVLKREELINGTVTTGHSFGGDIEAVNIYSGLLAAKNVLSADIVIVAMGPGIVGTGTPFGFSGMEQADVINAVSVLNGRPVAVPRISFADRRERHRGLSHHSQTVLGRATLAPAVISIPHMEKEKMDLVIGQLRSSGIFKKHRVALDDGERGLDLLKSLRIKVTTMGRTLWEDSEFFSAAAAAGSVAAKMLLGQEILFLEGSGIESEGEKG